MTNRVLYLIFPRMLAVVHPARTTQFANLVSQAKGIAAYVFLDTQAMTVGKVNGKELVTNALMHSLLLCHCNKPRSIVGKQYKI